MLYRMINLPIIVLLLSVVCACTPGVPDGVLSEGKMEKVLYDYHLAQGLAMQQSSDSVNYYTRLYYQAVFNKYDIDEATFDRSMEWYTRHTDRLGEIYKRMAERSGNRAEGSESNILLASGAQSLSGDSLNMWKGDTHVLLNSKGVNRFFFTLPADTALHASDVLQWQFFVDWHYHDGLRQAEAILAVEYENDSVSVTNYKIYSSGLQTLILRTADLRVKRIYGFIYQHAPWTERPRLLMLSNIRLLRLRNNTLQSSEPISTRTQSDTVASPNLRVTLQHRMRDSLLRQDTLNERRSHFR